MAILAKPENRVAIKDPPWPADGFAATGALGFRRAHPGADPLPNQFPCLPGPSQSPRRNTLSLPLQVFDVNGVMPPLPIHTQHPEESCRELEGLFLLQHGIGWQSYQGMLASRLV
jgi:hypothetical protein